MKQSELALFLAVCALLWLMAANPLWWPLPMIAFGAFLLDILCRIRRS